MKKIFAAARSVVRPMTQAQGGVSGIGE